MENFMEQFENEILRFEMGRNSIFYPFLARSKLVLTPGVDDRAM